MYILTFKYAQNLDYYLLKTFVGIYVIRMVPKGNQSRWYLTVKLRTVHLISKVPTNTELISVICII